MNVSHTDDGEGLCKKAAFAEDSGGRQFRMALRMVGVVAVGEDENAAAALSSTIGGSVDHAPFGGIALLLEA